MKYRDHSAKLGDIIDALAMENEEILRPEQFRRKLEARAQADPAASLDGVVALFGERLPYGAVRTLEIAAAAIRAAEGGHQYTPDPHERGTGCAVCGRQRLPTHSWTNPRKEAEGV
jgi:hypothetical protein